MKRNNPTYHYRSGATSALAFLQGFSHQRGRHRAPRPFTSENIQTRAPREAILPCATAPLPRSGASCRMLTARRIALSHLHGQSRRLSCHLLLSSAFASDSITFSCASRKSSLLCWACSSERISRNSAADSSWRPNNPSVVAMLARYLP